MSRIADIVRRIGTWLRPQPNAQTLQKPGPPHPLNVPGSFYVENGCCLACGVWEDVAPDLLAWSPDEFPHCYVARQPETDAEFERMKLAMDVADLDCIRVRNCKPEWQERLRADGLGDQIDP